MLLVTIGNRLTARKIFAESAENGRRGRREPLCSSCTFPGRSQPHGNLERENEPTVAFLALTSDFQGTIVHSRTSMNIVKATSRYEDWLKSHTAVVESDLRLKHKRMAEAVFPFLRATFYRWVQIWPDVCPDANKGPRFFP